MEERELRDLETIFAQVEDPRIERTKLHRLRDIIILANMFDCSAFYQISRSCFAVLFSMTKTYYVSRLMKSDFPCIKGVTITITSPLLVVIPIHEGLGIELNNSTVNDLVIRKACGFTTIRITPNIIVIIHLRPCKG